MKSENALVVDIQIALDGVIEINGGLVEQSLSTWANHAYSEVRSELAEMCLRIVDNKEIQALNKQYRGKDKVTNVLSFPFADEVPDAQWGAQVELDMPILGDVVISWPVIVEEAGQQGKTTEQHMAHMVIHGVLHLCGYDHQNDDEAMQMEQLETKLLSKIGINNPY